MGKVFGEYIKDIRIDRKMTLREVEEKAHISNAYLSQVERGERGTPTMKILVKLAEVYGVPVSVLNDKAEEELKLKETIVTLEAIRKSQNKTKPPTPDTDFICRGYESLSEEKKQTLKNFLQYLQVAWRGMR
jgi:transcriptional regulator with XRE-family HTH domain